ncbi:recombination mediator RecR [Patescibacteria group bacterium]
MASVPQPLQDVINSFAKLPGVGPKSASRLAYYLLKSSKEDLEFFAEAVGNMKEKLTSCKTCFTISETDSCGICSDTKRDEDTLCIVEEPLDIVAIEKAGIYNGKYHVLNGSLNPMEGIGPEDLKLKELEKRLEDEHVKEIIIATNATLEGETTARYIAKLPVAEKIKITRIARGLPAGSDIEYADEITLGRALEGRTQYN